MVIQLFLIFLLFYKNNALNIITDIFGCGKDFQSLYGSRIEYIELKNNNSIFYVNSNGYGTYNGLLQIYYLNNREIKNQLVIQFPYGINNNLYNNFGLKYSAYTPNEILVASPNYNIFEGIVFLLFISPYTFKYKISQVFVSPIKETISFGYNTIYNKNYIIISSYDNHIFIYKNDGENYNYINHLYKLNIHFGHQLLLYKDYLITSIFNDIKDPNYVIIYYLPTNMTAKILNSCKYFGSHIKHNSVYNLWSISCTYTEYNKLQHTYFDSRVYLYSNIINNYNINQTIFSPEVDLYFGNKVEFYKNHIFISGNNTIYQYLYYDYKYNYVNKYILSASKYGYEASFKIIDDILYVGIFSYKDYRGCVVKGKISNTTMYKIQNSNNNIPIIINKGDINNNQLSNPFNLAPTIYYIIIFAILCMILSILILIMYCCCYRYIIHISASIKDKKKKKKDEKDSPFKVHSYRGYIENDYEIKEITNINGKECDKVENDKGSPYKVYSYVGYNETHYPKYTQMSYMEKEKALLNYYNNRKNIK